MTKPVLDNQNVPPEKMDYSGLAHHYETKEEREARILGSVNVAPRGETKEEPNTTLWKRIKRLF